MLGDSLLPPPLVTRAHKSLAVSAAKQLTENDRPGNPRFCHLGAVRALWQWGSGLPLPSRRLLGAKTGPSRSRAWDLLNGNAT